MFWDEIKTLVTEKARAREDGKNSVTRSFYEQCYQLSLIDIDVVQKLSWRQWQDLLDRVGNREDERIFAWIKNSTGKIREDDWREFEKALHLYLKKKDTSVFSDYELFKSEFKKTEFKDINDLYYYIINNWPDLATNFKIEEFSRDGSCWSFSHYLIVENNKKRVLK